MRVFATLLVIVVMFMVFVALLGVWVYFWSPR